MKNCSAVIQASIEELIKKHFPLKPADILKKLDLTRPIYRKTAAYGHFRRNDPDFTWEKTDKAAILKKEAGKLGTPELKGEDVPLDGYYFFFLFFCNFFM